MDLRQLSYMVAAAEEGQLTRAAERVHVAQPALSQAIAKLEAELGVKLLERRPRGVELTDAGAAFVERARIALAAAEEAREAVSEWAPAPNGIVVGFLPSLASVARRTLRPFILANPEIEVETRELPLDARVAHLTARKIDVELLYPPPRQPELVEATMLHSPRYVLLHDEHRLAGHDSLEFDQIAEETFFARHPSVSVQWAEEAWLMNYRGTRPRLTEEAPVTADEVWALVARGKAISVLPEFLVEPIQGHGVRAVPLRDVEPLEVCIARRAGDRRSAVLGLVESLRMRQEPAAGGSDAEPEPPAPVAGPKRARRARRPARLGV